MSRKPDDEPGMDERRGDVPVHRSARVDEIEHRASPDHDGEPPVVARLVVEIRSDGSRTIARGALEDVQQGERVAVEARGSSPLSLAMGLMRSILSTPMLARAASRKLLGRSRPR